MAEPIIYVVDEDPLIISDLAVALAQQGGLDARIYSSASDLRSAVARTRPDAIICGIRLGSDDGLELLRELQGQDPELAIVIMTSSTDADGTARVITTVGPLCHVHKPCDMADLLPKLRAALHRRALSQDLQSTRDVLASREAALVESSRQIERASRELASKRNELTTATERLVQAEQLAAVGRVVTGIAHELSRQLALVGYAEAIKSRVADDSELVELADVIVNAQKRLVAMVDEIRDFVSADGSGDQSGGLDREPADVAAMIDEALALMHYDRDVRRRTIVRSFHARPLCALHRQKFVQVVINLVSNAVLATEPGDSIELELATTADHEAVLSVRDRGAGMAPEVLERLGEPFFTTRGDRGSGLGVGICMRIVEEHGGTLRFDSQVGLGTTARVVVPLLGEPGGPSRSSRPSRPRGQKPST